MPENNQILSVEGQLVGIPLQEYTAGDGIDIDNVNKVVSVANDFIKLLSVSGNHTTNVDSFTAVADVPDGYTFLCWVNMKTNGFSQAFYPLSPDATSCVWWKGGSISNPTGSSSHTCYYLVMKVASA